QSGAQRCFDHLSRPMSRATRTQVLERLLRGEWTCSGRYCGVVDTPNTTCADCRARQARYRAARREANAGN
ncbi:hypothetical protein QBC45DRAFT_304079, partial [Copromyces sp. CBS 386.78]